MMPTYEIYENSFGQEMICRTDEDGSKWYFGKDESNSDYQVYLASLEEGTIS